MEYFPCQLVNDFILFKLVYLSGWDVPLSEQGHVYEFLLFNWNFCVSGWEWEFHIKMKMQI